MLRTLTTILAALPPALVASAAMAQTQPDPSAPPPMAPVAVAVPAPPQQRLETQRQNVAAMVTGIVLMPTGGATLIAGALVTSSYQNCGIDCKPTDHRPLGYALMGVGAASVVAGIVLTVYGSHRVPVEGQAASRGPAIRSADVGLGPQGGTLTFHF